MRIAAITSGQAFPRSEPTFGENNMLLRSIVSFVGLAVSFATLNTANAATVSIVNLKTNDLGYSPVSGLVYASVPNASLSNANTLMPINPNTTALSTPIPIGFDPARIAV